MQYIKQGNTDIEVSRLCIGCMSFGERMEGISVDIGSGFCVPPQSRRSIVNFWCTNL